MRASVLGFLLAALVVAGDLTEALPLPASGAPVAEDRDDPDDDATVGRPVTLRERPSTASRPRRRDSSTAVPDRLDPAPRRPSPHRLAREWRRPSARRPVAPAAAPPSRVEDH